MNKGDIELLGDAHIATSIDTPLRNNAFDKSDDDLKLCVVFVGDNDRKNGKGFELSLSAGTKAPAPVKKQPAKKPVRGKKKKGGKRRKKGRK